MLVTRQLAGAGRITGPPDTGQQTPGAKRKLPLFTQNPPTLLQGNKSQRCAGGSSLHLGRCPSNPVTPGESQLVGGVLL